MHSLMHTTLPGCSPRTGATHAKPCRSMRSVRSSAAASAAAAAAELGIITRLIGQRLLKMEQHHSIIPLLSPEEHQLPFAAALHVYRPGQQHAVTGRGDQSNNTLAALQKQHRQQKQQRQHRQVEQQHATLPLQAAAAAAEDAVDQLVYISSGSNLEPLRQSAHQMHSGSSSSSNDSSSASTALVDLMYVLSGNGYFSTSSGVTQQISPGDSVIAHEGEVVIAAGTPPPADAPAQQASVSSSSHSAAVPLPSWHNLVPWLQLPQLPNVFRTSQPQLQLQQQQEEQLVLLQLLLPSELLTGELQHYNAGHCQAVAQQLPWKDRISRLGSDGCVDEHSVCELLTGALGPSQQQQEPQLQQDGSQSEAQEIQQQQQQLRLSPSHLDGTQAVDTTIDSSSSGGGADVGDSAPEQHSTSSSSGGGGHTLPPLSSQQVLKRGLSEVGSFQLPAQTNRLALLFGPHASPAVCLSFGVEVFEPGHVTPLHIHSSAHELFFVLAGKGLGVHGPGGRQRVELGPGDVAVFPPGVLHGVNNPSQQQLYCLQMMLPNEHFVEWVQSGQAAGKVDLGALQRLAAAASCG